MKRYFILRVLVLCALIIFVITSCKKDYPDDIPKWLKNIILDYKRNNGGCGNYGCLGIEEWSFKDSCKVYLFEWGGSLSGSAYDIDGNKVCLKRTGYNPDNWFLENYSCSYDIINLHSSDNFPLKNGRHIWSASYHKN